MPKLSLLVALLLPLITSASALAAEPAPAAAAQSADVQNVTPEAAEKLLQENKNIVVLDVRTAEEFSAGHIPGAKNIDFQSADFKKQLGALDKEKTYLLHCAAGNRSTRALKVLQEEKFAHIRHLDTGFNAWKKAGKQVEK